MTGSGKKSSSEPLTAAGCYGWAEEAAYAAAGRLTQGKLWLVWSTGLVVILSLFLAFPSYQDLSSDPQQAGKTWQAVVAKSENLRWNVLEKFGPSTNAARVNFRLTAPALNRLLHAGIPGLVMLQAFAGVFLLGTCVWLAATASGSRLIGLMTGVGAGATWAGATAFCELRGVFDGIALCLMLGAMASRGFVVAAVCVFAACWTDERALVSFPLLAVSAWMLYRAAPEYKTCGGTRLTGPIGGMTLGILLHLASRFLYAAWAGLPHRFDGNGLEVLLSQINNAPMGVWSGLEGGWLAVAGAVIVAWSRGQRLWSLVCLGAIGLVLAVSLAVVDISRTTAFLLPVLFAALAILRASEREESFRRLVFLSAAISVLWPMYYVGGKSTIWWVYPLPMQLIRLATGR